MHHSTTCRCSSWVRVGLSPVVPTGTKPLVPSPICHSIRSRKLFSSTEPFLKGVTRAVIDPRKLVFAAMARPQVRSTARVVSVPLSHSYRVGSIDERPATSRHDMPAAQVCVETSVHFL